MEEREKEKDQMQASHQMKEALEKQMDSIREQHQKQLSELRSEIDTKQARIDQLTEFVFFYIFLFFISINFVKSFISLQLHVHQQNMQALGACSRETEIRL